MKAFIFFSIHEELFHRVAEALRGRGVDSFGGFVWGTQQATSISGRGIDYDPLVVFTRDLLPACDDGRAPDLEWLEQRERELGMSIQRMLTSERHLLVGRSYERIMRMAEVALREVAAIYDRTKPDFVFSEDVSCFHSYVHFVLARERNIPFWCISSGRLPQRISVFSSAPQHWERLEATFGELVAHGLTDAERRAAEDYVSKFVERPVRPSGMQTRARKPRIGIADVVRLRRASMRYFGDRRDPTAVGPARAMQQRIRRIARVAIADVTNVFESPVAGEKYVLYPIHFQPEASTLVQAPLYLDQLALLQDLAASLPVGHRLYVKEHVSNRGRRPLAFYRAIREIPAARLLGPDEDTWSLIRNASVIAVITGTMGWEGLMFGKPVVTFGDIFFNQLPQVYRAYEAPKDRWFEVLSQAATNPRVDREAVLAMVCALQRSSYPGFIGNADAFPEVLEAENVAKIADALALEARLTR